MMVLKYDSIRTTEVPTGHTLNAVLYAVDLWAFTWFLGWDNDRQEVIFA
jgi:hypothetical protein